MSAYHYQNTKLIGALLVLAVPGLGVAQESYEQAGLAENANSDGETFEAITARKLFLEGRALLERQQFAPACERLERSHKLVPTLGTLLNLGLCHSFSGHLATAHE